MALSITGNAIEPYFSSRIKELTTSPGNTTLAETKGYLGERETRDANSCFALTADEATQALIAFVAEWFRNLDDSPRITYDGSDSQEPTDLVLRATKSHSDGSQSQAKVVLVRIGPDEFRGIETLGTTGYPLRPQAEKSTTGLATVLLSPGT